jgi:beta-N-acetylhexosaminidase
MRVLVLLLLLAGCAVGPDYRKPDAPVAPKFKEAEGFREAQPRDQLPRGSWWTVFGDPELDKLMQRVDISNQNIKVAEARLRQARGVADQARAGLFPTVSANASAIRSKAPNLANQPNFASGAVDNYAVGLTANWDLDLWGRVRRSVEAGEANIQVSAAQLEAARLSARLIAEDLAELGITVDAAPVLDLPTAGADPIIGDRAWGTDPARVARLGRAVCDGLLAGGVLPIIKHIPGHGRARVDSHKALPRVDDDRAVLARADFAPFRALADMPWAMTAHIVYTAIDAAAPATLSRIVIDDVIRGEIGFDGVLVSDDISMGALAGSFAERTRRALDAGCDLVLHCNGDMAEMEAVAAAARPLTAEAQARIARAEELRQSRRKDFDARAAERRFAELISGRPATSSMPA